MSGDSYPTFFYTPKLLRRAYGAFQWLSVRRTLAKVAQETVPDAVIGYWAHPDGYCAVRLARQLGVPAVVMVGGSDVLLLTLNPSRRRRIVSVLHAADGVIAVSDDIRTRLCELGIAEDKLYVVRRGVDRKLFRPGDRLSARRRLGLPLDRPVVLWVGRMEAVKRVDLLVEALAMLRARSEINPLAVFVGSGSQRAAIEESVQRQRLEGSVRFELPVAHDVLGEWYRAADFTVLPSESEGVPNVLLESLACGTPFIASAVGGIPEIATPDSDLLVAPNDAEALAASLITGLTRVGRLPSRFPLIDWNDSARRVIDIVESLSERIISRSSSTVAGEPLG